MNGIGKGEQIWAGVLGLGLTLLVLSPLLSGRDGFPLSTYPMFSSRRPEVAWFARALAMDAEGQTQTLSPSLVVSGEPMLAVATLRRTFGQGPEATEKLCREIAARVAKDAAYVAATRVRLDQAELSVLGRFRGETDPRQVRVLAECPVERAP